MRVIQTTPPRTGYIIFRPYRGKLTVRWHGGEVEDVYTWEVERSPKGSTIAKA